MKSGRIIEPERFGSERGPRPLRASRAAPSRPSEGARFVEPFGDSERIGVRRNARRAAAEAAALPNHFKAGQLQCGPLSEQRDVRFMVVAMALALFVSCDGSANGADNASRASPAVSGTQSATNAITNQSAAKAEMVRVAGGEFTMGDKNEVDAPLHTVRVSPFFIDARLV